MGRRIYIIPESMDVDDAIDDAKAANCPEIVQGITPALAGLIDEGSLPVAYEESEQPEVKPNLCTHWAILEGINPAAEKPLTVKRTHNGIEYTCDCYVTESVKDQYLSGDIAVGDYVIVEFLEESLDRAVVIAKVFKTW